MSYFLFLHLSVFQDIRQEFRSNWLNGSTLCVTWLPLCWTLNLRIDQLWLDIYLLCFHHHKLKLFCAFCMCFYNEFIIFLSYIASSIEVSSLTRLKDRPTIDNEFVVTLIEFCIYTFCLRKFSSIIKSLFETEPLVWFVF